jgi:hypothetical protein
MYKVVATLNCFNNVPKWNYVCSGDDTQTEEKNVQAVIALNNLFW